MRHKFIYITTIILLSTCFCFAQQTDLKWIKGSISYISSQNIYVKFDDTGGIENNDTLFFQQNDKLIPAVLVKHLSSTSCAGIKLLDFEVSVGMTLFAVVQSAAAESLVENKEDSKFLQKENFNLPLQPKLESKTTKPQLRGRFSISSYSNLSNIAGDEDYQKWRYRFSFNADRVLNSKLSFENYITFSYRANQWNEISKNFGRALRIYGLAATYNFNDKISLSAGRKIYSRLSNIGAVDGIEFQISIDGFSFGAVAGSRPNFSDYGLNLKLFQFGGFISRIDSLNNGFMENTLAFFDQSNNFKTDRRFLYFQHVNSIIPKITLFASTEIDLYKKFKGISKNELSLTSLYISARYSPAKFISFSTSYDARKNVIYYETFKSLADSIIEVETRQGFRIQTIIRPINYLFASFDWGYRFKPGDYKPSRNFAGRLTYSRIPLVNSSLSVSFNRLFTSYLEGQIYGVDLSKNFDNPRLNLGMGFRKVEYKFTTSAYNLNQNIITIDLSYNIVKNLSLSASYENTFEKNRSYSRIYLNLNTSL